MIDTIKELFKSDKPDKQTFLLIKESDLGITTYINPVLNSMNDSYKKQIISFLNQTIKNLENKK